jgi:hypothetical protein
MIVGMQQDSFLAVIAEREGLPYADALRGYAIEELLRRIYQSDYSEFLWLKEAQTVEIKNYGRRQDSCLEFYYVESSKYIAPGKIIPGVSWSERFRNQMQADLFEAKDAKRISWAVETVKDETAGETKQCSCIWTLQASYQNMLIPVMVRVMPLFRKDITPEKRTVSLIADSGKKLLVYAYSSESRLAEDFFEIMKMLELISDMGTYDRVNHILKTESVNGRHIMERMQDKIKEEPRTLREKRLDQLKGYRDYAYMKKRWEQYERRHGKQEEPWTEVMDRLIRFAEPIWGALCRKEVFFDDWMPELSRFLG